MKVIICVGLPGSGKTTWSKKEIEEKTKQGEKWILIDYINVVVHCMMSEARYFYNLEEVWHDAERKEYKEPEKQTQIKY